MSQRLSFLQIMSAMAETILERDKKRGGGIVLTMPTNERRSRSPKSSGPGGEAYILANSFVAPPHHSQDYASSSRLGFSQNIGFHRAHNLEKTQ